jgi:hypothetical protein
MDIGRFLYLSQDGHSVELNVDGNQELPENIALA